MAPSVGSMNLVLCWYLIGVSFSQHSVHADLDIYPEFPEEVVVKRFSDILLEWRQKNLHILQVNNNPEPPFTFHFPETPNNPYESNLFAVPPSDQRYYQPDLDPDFVAKDVKESERLPTENDNLEDVPTVTEVLTPIDDEISAEKKDAANVENDENISYVFKKILAKDNEDIVLIAIIAGCGAASAAGLVALTIGWYKFHHNAKAAADIEYPAYGVTGPNKETTPNGDRRLAQSAQMYHYQHQKQQIIAMESSQANNERRGSISDGDSDEENEEGDYTVYECPGLAAAGELEVKNPMFLDDPTPAAGNHSSEAPPAAPN